MNDISECDSHSSSQMRYILVVFPSGKSRPLNLGEKRIVDLSTFCRNDEPEKTSGYALYYISPSWIHRLPSQGVFIPPDECFKNIPDFRFQFLPESTCPYILRVYPKIKLVDENNQISPQTSEKEIMMDSSNISKIDKISSNGIDNANNLVNDTPLSSMNDNKVKKLLSEIKLASWNILFEKENEMSFTSLIESFQNCYCLFAKSFEFECETSNKTSEIDFDRPVLHQLHKLSKIKVFLVIKTNYELLLKTKQRNDILNEIITTETNFVNCIKTLKNKITCNLFQNQSLYEKSIKTISDVIPAHTLFLEELLKIGVSPETSIGALFKTWMPAFKLCAAYFRNYKSLSEDIKKLMETNQNFSSKIKQILKQFFDGVPIDSIFIKPIQRIPQYPTFLERIKKCTPKEHWDYYHIQKSIGEMKKILDDLDHSSKNQQELDAIAKLQEEFGSELVILKSGRRLIDHIDFPERKKDIFLFSDIIVFRNYGNALNSTSSTSTNSNGHHSNNHNSSNTHKFIKIPLTNILSFEVKGNEYVINENISFPKNHATEEFEEKFKKARSQTIIRLRTFGRAIVWSEKSDGSSCSRKPNVKNGAMVTHNNCVWLFGGIYQNGYYSNDLWIFSGGIWEKRQTMNPPEPRCMHTMCTDPKKNKIYIFGGKNRAKYFNDLYSLDLTTLSWTLLISKNSIYPTPRIGHTSLFISSNLYIFGGVDQYFHYYDDFYEYDFSLREWNVITDNQKKNHPYHKPRRSPPNEKHPTLYNSREPLKRMTESFYINKSSSNSNINSIYSTNTTSSHSPSNLNPHSSLKFSYSGDILKVKKDKPAPRAFHASFIGPDQTFGVHGGENNYKKYKDLWLFDFSKKRWVKQSIDKSCDSPGKRSKHSAVMYDGQLYVIGGCTKLNNATDTYRINLNKTFCNINFPSMSQNDNSAFRWEKIPESMNPKSFDNGLVVAIENMGFIAYQNSIYKIRLNIKQKGQDMFFRQSINHSGSLYAFSNPVFNPVEKTVTACADNVSLSTDFVVKFDQEHFLNICKCANDGIFWRFSYLLEPDGRSTIERPNDKYLLDEKEFTPRRKSQTKMAKGEDKSLPKVSQSSLPNKSKELRRKTLAVVKVNQTSLLSKKDEKSSRNIAKNRKKYSSSDFKNKKRSGHSETLHHNKCPLKANFQLPSPNDFEREEAKSLPYYREKSPLLLPPAPHQTPGLYKGASNNLLPPPPPPLEVNSGQKSSEEIILLENFTRFQPNELLQ
ncbi:hypothetical protein TRFO_09386 [Tritrichomonas foetus]|uniref:DH domain-containing protein n=1 Tax=Tritrichomonas foetus TaxID=1144522 RepID=A0A1J4JJI6_9EUKA|nr:hypothetical protein TRFO_09386 [Tritrichomonas foetus]|eukprot:OHS97412.1 hypothetical protein TRFO_09386 [Tritrichomonas foetus]